MDNDIVVAPRRYISCGVIALYKTKLLLQSCGGNTEANPSRWSLIGGSTERQDDNNPLTTIQRAWKNEVVYSGCLNFEEILYDHVKKRYFFLLRLTKKITAIKNGKDYKYFSYEGIMDLGASPEQKLDGILSDTLIRYPIALKKLIKKGDPSLYREVKEFIKIK